MFGPAYEAGCPACSSIADTLDPNAVHLRARDVRLICSSRPPLEKLIGYRDRMGWSFNWVSTVGSDFHRDLGFLHSEEELKPLAASRTRIVNACRLKIRCSRRGRAASLAGSRAPALRPRS